MLRRSLLYLSSADWARNIAMNWPLARRVARRYVAGEQIQEALASARELHEKGIFVTLDYLGESVHSEADTKEVIDMYLTLLDQIRAENIEASISVKLTHIGFDISEELVVTNLRHILTRAKQHGIAVTIDMESSTYTGRTLRIYRTMRDEYDFDNVGTVIQAYLHRSENDIAELASEPAHIRLCKGAYLESPEIAYQDKQEVSNQYIRLMGRWFGTPGESYLAIATHDENMIHAGLQIIDALAVPNSRYEFQMLYGVRADRQESLQSAGHKVRVYVPFGSTWYPYFVRRLAERPANLIFFLRSLLP